MEVQTLYNNQVIYTEQEYHVKSGQDPTRSWQIHKDGMHKYGVTKHIKNRLSALQNHIGRQLYSGNQWISDDLGQMRPSIPGCAGRERLGKVPTNIWVLADNDKEKADRPKCTKACRMQHYATTNATITVWFSPNVHSSHPASFDVFLANRKIKLFHWICFHWIQ